MLVCDCAEIIETEVCGCTWGAEDEDAGCKLMLGSTAGSPEVALRITTISLFLLQRHSCADVLHGDFAVFYLLLHVAARHARGFPRYRSPQLQPHSLHPDARRFRRLSLSGTLSLRTSTALSPFRISPARYLHAPTAISPLMTSYENSSKSGKVRW